MNAFPGGLGSESCFSSRLFPSHMHHKPSCYLPDSWVVLQIRSITCSGHLTYSQNFHTDTGCTATQKTPLSKQSIH